MTYDPLGPILIDKTPLLILYHRLLVILLYYSRGYRHHHKYRQGHFQLIPTLRQQDDYTRGHLLEKI